MVGFASLYFTENEPWARRTKRMLRYPLIMAAKIVWHIIFRVDIPNPKKKLLQISRDDVMRLEEFLKGKMA